MKGKSSDAAGLPYLALVALPAALSFVWFRLVRALLTAAKARYLARHPASSRQWQVFSQPFLEKPLVLPLLLTTAPRWNPHAVIGTLGPFFARERIAIDAAAARRSGEWFFVIYRHPGRETVGSCSHLNDPGSPWVEFKVPAPGHYAIGARYYHPRSPLEFPAVQADGDAVGSSLPVPPGVNDFYSRLQQRDRLFYRSLAFYVWVLVRGRAHLPAAWVHREFLPVGNPETRFAFGAFRRGEIPAWSAAVATADQDHDCFVTLYSRASLPVTWFEANRGTPSPATPAPADGFYLVRLQPKKRPATTETLTAAEKSVSVGR